MGVRTVSCSACDRNVTLMVEPDGTVRRTNTDCVCLDYGEKCTGERCPILASPSEEVRANLARLRAQG